jgi:hypothetical protein
MAESVGVVLSWRHTFQTTRFALSLLSAAVWISIIACAVALVATGMDPDEAIDKAAKAVPSRIYR